MEKINESRFKWSSKTILIMSCVVIIITVAGFMIVSRMDKDNSPSVAEVERQQSRSERQARGQKESTNINGQEVTENEAIEINNSELLSSEDGVEAGIAITSSPQDNTIDRYARFTFSAEDHVDSFECSLNDSKFEACTSPAFYLDVGAAGGHSFNVRGLVDGMPTTVASYDWNITSVFAAGNNDLIPATKQPDKAEPRSWRGILRINCDFSHSSYDDPIVFPGEKNAAHLHRFYGNTLLDHTTTDETLYTKGESTCQGNLLNLTAYWVPALLSPQNGDSDWRVVPAVVGDNDVAHEVFYYSAGVDDLESIQPIPAGLRMIAGSHKTVPGEEQDTSIVRWHCQSWESSDGANPNFSASIPECAAPDRVRADIFFPSCWNGTDLDSVNHKNHMAYPVKEGGETVCPSSHPIPIVRPSYHLAYGVKPDVYDPVTRTSEGWRLASDSYTVNDDNPGGLSLHGDWFNGWHPEVMEALLNICIKGGFDCHDGNLANGFRLSGVQPGTKVEPVINNGGFSF